MPDLYADDQQAFLTAARAAEEAAVGPGGFDAIDIPTDTPTDETVSSEKPRDPDTGRFVAADADTNDDVTPEPAVVEEQPTAAERLLAGKYKTIEDLERAHENLQALADRQANELGFDRRADVEELKQAFEQRLAEIEARANRRQITPDMIQEDPARAVEIAWEQQDEYTLRRAFEVWREEDPFTAATWAAAKQQEQREAALRAELEQVKQQVAQVQTPVQQQADTQTWREAWALAEQSDPKIREVANTILNEVAPAYAHVFAPALSGDARQRADALEAMAQIARGRQQQAADTLDTAVVDAVTETAREAQQARSDAYVASQDTAGGAAELTWEQREQQKMRDTIASKSNNWWGG